MQGGHTTAGEATTGGLVAGFELCGEAVGTVAGSGAAFGASGGGGSSGSLSPATDTIVWRCASDVGEDEGWYRASFDDSAWGLAAPADPEQAAAWAAAGAEPDYGGLAPTAAEWIWAQVRAWDPWVAHMRRWRVGATIA